MPQYASEIFSQTQNWMYLPIMYDYKKTNVYNKDFDKYVFCPNYKQIIANYKHYFRLSAVVKITKFPLNNQ